MSKQYDFDNFRKICNNIISNRKVNSNLLSLKKELNKFFKEAICENVLITENNGLFFGARLYTKLPVNWLYEAITREDYMYKYTTYDIEIDSRLFDPFLEITADEMISMLLHEIGHIVENNSSSKEVIAIIDEYVSKNRETLSPEKVKEQQELLIFGVTEYISKRKSIFFAPNNEILADDYAYEYGFKDPLLSLQNKLITRGFKLNNKNNPFTTLQWALYVYKDMGLRRNSVIRTLEKAKKITSSKLERREIEKVIKSIDKNIVREGLDIPNIFSQRITKMHDNAYKDFESDYYDLNMKCKNVQQEDEAIYLMRQINLRISIIDDYINYKKLNESSRIKWVRLLEDFLSLRDKLSNSTIYKAKNYGIFVNYPDIVVDNY